MSTLSVLERQICDYVESHRDRLVEIIRDLVRIPSENKPPLGAERECQEYTARFLSALGLQPDVYELSEVDGLLDHPLYWPGNNYANRPNVGARRKGKCGGRSLVLSGHIDTVPCGTPQTLQWTRDPFGGQVEGNRLYGRGSNDMKGGVGINLFIMEALANMDVTLGGDLVFESVVDEEFGGVNGTLAGRLRGFNGDAAVITEPSFLRLCVGHRGGRTVHITLKAPGGTLGGVEFPKGVLPQLTCFLNAVKAFEEHRRNAAPQNALFAQSIDRVPVSITKVFTSNWGTDEPITVPETCKLEMYWQLMPGESQENVEQEFFDWLDRVVDGSPKLFPSRPEVTFPIRWLPGSEISKSEPLVSELAGCASKVLGCEPPIEALDGPCDMFVFHQGFAIPAVVWGPRGGNTHGANEYLEIDSALIVAKSLLMFICDWCGMP